MITVLESPQEASRWCLQQRENKRSLGYVATMGALHQGHQSLVSQSVRNNEVTFASIFVNPLQFNNPLDLENYPKNLASDISILEQTGCNMVFTGTLEQFFPNAEDIRQIKPVDPGPAGKGLEGEFRPGHLEGVATIVYQLFQITGSCKAYFGEKDFQQTLVVRYLAEKLQQQAIHIDVVTCPTIRESSGLAMSSRNQRLSPAQRQIAAGIYGTLSLAKDAWRSGIQMPRELEKIMRLELDQQDFTVEYASIRDQDNWTANTPDQITGNARALVAAQIGGIRLIDNLYLGASIGNDSQSNRIDPDRFSFPAE
jgi:pantoate--beta-alanine ligase